MQCETGDPVHININVNIIFGDVSHSAVVQGGDRNNLTLSTSELLDSVARKLADFSPETGKSKP